MLPSLAWLLLSHGRVVPDALKEPEREMHVPQQRGRKGWVAIGYAYGHWKQALRRRSGIDEKDATPRQIAAFTQIVQSLSATTKREREASTERATTMALATFESFAVGDWTDDLPQTIAQY